MKFLMAMDGETLDKSVSRRFGHAACFLVVEADSRSVEVFTGDVEQMSHHGLDRFADTGLAGVITGNIGPHAWDDAQAHGLKVFIARNLTGEQALRDVQSGEITAATGPTMRKSLGDGHHHG